MKQTLIVQGSTDSVEKIMAFVLQAGKQAGLPRKKFDGMRLAVEEFVTNSIQHGYEANKIQGDIQIDITFEANTFNVTIVDSAPAYDPRTQATPNIDGPIEERQIGGLGIFLALKNSDEYQYHYQDGKNINTLAFKNPSEPVQELLISQLDAVRNLEGLLNESLTDFASAIDTMRSEVDKLHELLKAHKILAPSRRWEANFDSRLTKMQNSVTRVTSQLGYFQNLLIVSSSIYSSSKLDDVLDTVMEEVLRLTKADRASLFLREQGTGNLNIKATRSQDGNNLPVDEVPYSRNIVEMAFSKREPIITIDAQENKKLKGFSSVFSQSIRSVICIPLMMDGEVMGVLYADNNLKNGKLNENLIPLLSIYASQVVAAIEHVHILDRLRYEARLEHEIKIAEDIQSDFLPASIPSLAGWKIDTFFAPAREVAGDFYDVFLLGEKFLVFIVGDVCDKGLGSALFMALTRSLLRAYTEQQFAFDMSDVTTAENHLDGIAAMLQNVMGLTNDYIMTNHGRTNMFTTLFFGIVEPVSHALIYVNAGHNPPCVVDSSGTLKQLLKGTAPGIGMFPDMVFTTQHVEIAPGDFIIGYTDGLTEAKNKSGQFFGDERLFNFFEHEPPSTASDAVARLRTAVTAHVDGAPNFDDITLLVVHHPESEQ